MSAVATEHQQRTDFSDVTEVPGNRVSRDAVAMAETRYGFASRRCRGKRVLELACGPGVGLGQLAAQARTCVGGDLTFALLQRAAATYQHRIPLTQLDAHALPFASGAYDVVVMFEALYFVPDAERALRECARILAPGGALILGMVNPARPGFIAAPGSTHYFRAVELTSLLARLGLPSLAFGAFPLERGGLKAAALSIARKVAGRLHLVPTTMKGKELLKRMVFGKLERFPDRIEVADARYREPVELADPADADRYTVFYLVSTKHQ